MAQLNRHQAEQAVKQTLLAYTTRLEKAEKIQDQLRPEAGILIKHGKLIRSTVNRYDFDEKFLEPLSLTGIQQFLTVCMHLAEHFDLPTLSLIKNADVIENPKVFKITPHTTGSDSAQSVAVEQGRTVTFTLDKTADYVRDGNMSLSVEWKRYKVTADGTEDDSSWLNGVKNTFDDRQYDRDFSFPDKGTYKICADIYETAREGTVKHLWEHHDIQLEVLEGDIYYKNMAFTDKLALAMSLSDWKSPLSDAASTAVMVASCAVILGIIAATPLDEVLAVLAPLFETLGIAGTVTDAVRAVYLLADFVNRVQHAQSREALYEAGQIWAQAVVMIGMEALFAFLGKFAGKKKLEIERKNISLSKKTFQPIKDTGELNEYIKNLSLKSQYMKKIDVELKKDPTNLKRFINRYGDEAEELINRNGYPPKYWKARPKYGNTQVDDTWKNAKLDEDNIFFEKNGVEYIKTENGIVSWDKTKIRNSQWDMGHLTDDITSPNVYAKEYDRYLRGEISEKKFLEWYRESSNYEPQLPSYNRGLKEVKK